MKRTRQLKKIRGLLRWASVPGVCLTASSLWAAETNAPPAAPAPEKPMSAPEMFEGGAEAPNNWVEVSAGGLFGSGSQAQLQKARQTRRSGFGGIEDFHYQNALNKTTTLTMDGRALFDEHDYKIKLGIEKEKFGYLRVSYTQFRDWSNGNGGFDPASGNYYALAGHDALGLDRGKLVFEGGLTLENKPAVTFKYTHNFRSGEDSSTIWGSAHPALGVNQALSPSFYDLHEHSDNFQIDVTHTIKTTDFGAGFTYETGRLNDALKISQYPGEIISQNVTDRQDTSYDLLNAHAFTETWLKKNLMFSTGLAFSDLRSEFTGSRIYGSGFDAGYAPGALAGYGYNSLNGSTHLNEYVTDLNLFYKPTPHFSIVPSIRIQKENTDASALGFETLGSFSPVPFSASSNRGDLDVRERLDATYNGVTNWVFYARGEWDQGNGDLTASGGLIPMSGIGVAPIQQQTDDHRLFQKYSAGTRWYPLRGASLDLGGYYKRNEYDYDHNVDSTPNNSVTRYPGYLVMQSLQTYDGNVRLTLHPWSSVTLVSRYEYQLSDIDTKPDQISGLPSVQASTMNSHIVGQDASWSPWSRLSLQLGVNYVQSVTKTPASEVTQAILNARNNYWTATFSPSFVIDDRTDLKLTYFYYRAADYRDNSSAGVSYGAGGEEQSVTANLVRRINKNIRVSLKYGFFQGRDALYGGNANYTGQLVYTSLQYRF